MVPVSLIRPLRASLRVFRRCRPFFVAAGLVGGCTLLLIGLRAADRDQTSEAGAEPSLLDLLDRVGKERERSMDEPRRIRAPRAPRSRSWRSPLAHQCNGVDPALRRRLDALQGNTEQWRSTQTIHPTNFGDRFQTDAFGQPLDSSPRVVVMHETVYGMTSAINTFLTPHPRDEDQVSYHTLIGLDGQVVDLVDPLKRAYGAGNSAFLGEWAVTNRKLKGSVNNFALRLSLETPLSGENDAPVHTGYSQRQYDALALVLADWMETFSMSPAAITTHRHVDLGGERSDPRSFDWNALQRRLAALGYLCNN